MRPVIPLLPLLPLLAMGCLKPTPAQTSAQQQPVRLVTALGSYEDQAVDDLPDDVIDRIGQELSSRKLTPEPVGVFAKAFGLRRGIEERLGVLEEAGIAQPLLLVSCDPRYDTQVNGRFRWSVDCDVALASPELDGGPIVADLSAAAHPVYYHQREAAAVSEVSALLARKVGNVLDQWLAMQGSGVAAPAPVAPPTTAPRLGPAPVPAPTLKKPPAQPPAQPVPEPEPEPEPEPSIEKG